MTSLSPITTVEVSTPGSGETERPDGRSSTKERAICCLIAVVAWLVSEVALTGIFETVGIKAVSLSALTGAIFRTIHFPACSTLFVCALIWLPPGAPGELGASVGAACLITLTVVSIRYTRRTGLGRPFLTSRLYLTAALLATLYWLMIAVIDSSLVRTFAIHILVIATVAGMCRVPRLMESLLRLSIYTVAWVTLGYVSYVFSSTTTQIEQQGSPSDPTWRTEFVYSLQNSLVVTNSTGEFGLQRAVGFAAEPGTWAIYSLLAAVAATSVFRKGSRIFWSGLCILSLLSTHSSGSMSVAVLSAGAALALQGLKAGLTSPIKVLLGSGLLLASLAAVNTAISYRASTNIASLTDRGFDTSGDFVGVDGSRINLLASLSLDGPVTILLFGAMLALLATSSGWRGRASVIFMLGCGILLQPIQFHFGAIALMLMIMKYESERA